MGCTIPSSSITMSLGLLETFALQFQYFSFKMLCIENSSNYNITSWIYQLYSFAEYTTQLWNLSSTSLLLCTWNSSKLLEVYTIFLLERMRLIKLAPFSLCGGLFQHFFLFKRKNCFNKCCWTYSRNDFSIFLLLFSPGNYIRQRSICSNRNFITF